MKTPRSVVRLAALSVSVLMPLLSAAPAAAGSPVGPGVIMLPPVVAKYDERCLERIDKKDEKLAARQSRDCRKPRGSRNALPVTDKPDPNPK